MARNIRIEYPGAFYHVLARGYRGERIFLDDEDRRFFLNAVSESCGMTGWRVHAWVLLPNEYHLVVETPEANLVSGMKWVQNLYTRRFNLRYRKTGKVFGDRYKSVNVEGHDTWYYLTLLDYVHLSPVRAGLVKPKQGKSIAAYPWSSVASAYALPAKKRAPWMAVGNGLEAVGFSDTAEGRRRFVERLDQRGREEGQRDCGVAEGPKDGRLSNLRQGWYWGTQAFSEKLSKIADAILKKQPKRMPRSGAVQNRHDAREAESLVVEGLAACGLLEKDLAGLFGSDPRKLKIASAVRERTTVPNAWIARRLCMGSAANVSQQLRRYRR